MFGIAKTIRYLTRKLDTFRGKAVSVVVHQLVKRLQVGEKAQCASR